MARYPATCSVRFRICRTTVFCKTVRPCTTLILTYDIPMENLKRMLGHKNIAVTQIYGKILKTNVEKNVNKRLKKLK